MLLSRIFWFIARFFKIGNKFPHSIMYFWEFENPSYTFNLKIINIGIKWNITLQSIANQHQNTNWLYWTHLLKEDNCRIHILGKTWINKTKFIVESFFSFFLCYSTDWKFLLNHLLKIYDTYYWHYQKCDGKLTTS